MNQVTKEPIGAFVLLDVGFVILKPEFDSASSIVIYTSYRRLSI